MDIIFLTNLLTSLLTNVKILTKSNTNFAGGAMFVVKLGEILI